MKIESYIRVQYFWKSFARLIFYQRRQWHPTPVLLPGKSHGQRSLVGCSLWGREESDMTERLHVHFSLSCIGEGNVLAWRIPGTGEPGELPSMGLHRVGHDWSDLAAALGLSVRLLLYGHETERLKSTSESYLVIENMRQGGRRHHQWRA